MKTIEAKGKWWGYSAKDTTPIFSRQDMSEYGYVSLSEECSYTISLLPDGEIISQQLEALARKEVKLRDELNEKLKQINEKRQQLLAITCEVQPATQEVVDELLDKELAHADQATHVDYACEHGELESACHICHPELLEHSRERDTFATGHGTADDIPF